ncbi:MAG: hypothetical protein EZS28_036685, partial [Streblomastix strix]
LQIIPVWNQQANGRGTVQAGKITDPGNLDRNVDQTWHLHSYPNLHCITMLSLIIKRISDSGRSQSANQKVRLSLNRHRIAYQWKLNTVLIVMNIEDNDQINKETKVALNLRDISESSKQDVMLPNRLLNRIDKWQQINVDYWIEMGTRHAWTSEYSLNQLQLKTGQQMKNKDGIGESKFQEELDQKLKLGVIRQAKDEEILYWNAQYTVSKAGGKRRMIPDYAELNAATNQAYLQMENINTMIQLIHRGDHSTHLDMGKAYPHARVSQELQKYFGFHFRGKAYIYLGLLFGWNRRPMWHVVEASVEQMDRNCQERRKSEDQGSGIRYCRAELRKDVASRCIVAYEDIVQSINISSVQEYLKRQMHDGQKITRRLDIVVGESQGELANVLQVDTSKRNANHGCIGNELGAVLELITMEKEPIYIIKQLGKQRTLKSSNQREMTANLMALRSPRDSIPIVSCFLVRTDNTVTEFCARKWKAKYDLLQIVRSIRKHVLENNLKLEMIHIQRYKNITADSLSRIAANGDST